MNHWIETAGLIGGVVMPLFNLPLIVRMVRRKSSADLSVVWASGVWICILLMTPQALRTHDPALKGFGIMNVIFFTIVFFLVLKYRKSPEQKGELRR